MKNQYKVLMVVLSPLLLLMLLTPTTVEAANIERVKFEDSNDCYINLDGDIKDSDAKEIVTLMENDDCVGKTTTLVVNSTGGSQKGGKYVQDAIEFYKLNTKVNPKGIAVSAGFTILMSGEEVTISDSSRIGHHSPWIPETTYNLFYMSRSPIQKGPKPLLPYGHMLIGQQMIVDAIADDIDIVPAWLIVKYAVEIEGSVYWLTPVDKLKLHKEGFVTLLNN